MDSHVSRRHKRQHMGLSGRLETVDGNKSVLPCTLVDMSVGGAKVSAEMTEQCEHTLLIIDNFGRFSADVVWRKSPYVGLRFNEKPEDVAEVLIGMAVYG